MKKIGLIIIMMSFFFMSCTHKSSQKDITKIVYVKDSVNYDEHMSDYIYDNTLKRYYGIAPNITGDGYINSQIAFSLARTVLSEMYGAERIERAMPLKIKLDNGIWLVEGSHPKSYEKNGVTYLPHGGTPHIEIRKSDGKILNAFIKGK